MDAELRMRGRLLAEGWSDKELRQLRRSGELRVLRRGAYLPADPPHDPAARHPLLVRAALEHLTGDVVVSHVSAALLHGLPVWGAPLDRVHVTRDRRRSGGRRGTRVHVHAAPLASDEIVVVDGVALTSVERTLVDLGRSQPFEQVVVTADAALRTRAAQPEGLEAALRRRPRWPGLPAARRALAFADGRSESPGESRSRVALARAGLPVPVLQWEVRGSGGLFVGRVDFGWPELLTVGEFDGRTKYGRLLRPEQTAGDAVYAEKLREDALRAVGLAVVRWGWTALDDFAPVAARLRAQFRPR